MSGKRIPDLTGQRFGRWSVGELAKHPTRDGVFYECVCDCGNGKLVQNAQLFHGRSRSCGCGRIEMLRSHTGENAFHWKGGRIVNNCGYVFVRNQNHPRAMFRGGSKYVREHILVMEESLGRHLLPDERVHHINGDKQDNRIENLELWTKPHPTGMKVEDQVRQARRVLAMYGHLFQEDGEEHA